MRVTAKTITDEQILEIEDDTATSPSMRWECQVARRDPRLRQRANKTAARVAAARSAVAAAWNARHGATP